MADTNLLVLAREYKKLREEVKKVLSMPKGDKGDQGEKGEKGDTGDTGPQGFPGRDGKDGINGYDGKEGRDGVDGKDGKDGLDGVGVANAYIDFDNSLVIVLTDGREVNAGFLSQETKDNVVATFKQGAATINELLPPQAGNANKFLKTDGTDVSWDTLDGSDINLSSPPVIGNVTPNAGTFTTLTANSTSQFGRGSTSYVQADGGATPYVLAQGAANANLTVGSNGTGTLFLRTNGGGTTQAAVAHTASAVNFVQVTGAATGGQPNISAQGSDANVTLRLSSKGSGVIDLAANGNPYALQVQGVASGANYNSWRLISGAGGSGANSTPVMSTWGIDTNISMVFQSKGTGAINLAPGSRGVNISNGGTVTALTRTAAGSGYTSVPSVAVSAPTTAGGVQATATCTVGVATFAVAAGGTGYTVGNVLTVVGGTGTAATFTVATLSGSAVATVTSTNAGSYSAVPTNPVSTTGGTGTGCTININTYAVTSGGFTITNAGSGYVEQPTVTFSGGGGSGAAAYATVGSGTVIRSLGTTGTQTIDFAGPSYISASIPMLRLRDIGTSDTFVQIVPNVSYTQVLAQGNSNAALALAANGSGRVSIQTNGTSQTEQLRVAHTASAVNFVQVTGAATGTSPQISSQGSDANIGLQLRSKGTGAINLMTQGGLNQAVVFNNGNGHNFLGFRGGNTGVAPIVSAEGSDTNIDLALTPKGTGLVRFGTYTASMALTVQGYVEIKDSGGTIRRLAVVA